MEEKYPVDEFLLLLSDDNEDMRTTIVCFKGGVGILVEDYLTNI